MYSTPLILVWQPNILLETKHPNLEIDVFDSFFKILDCHTGIKGVKDIFLQHPVRALRAFQIRYKQKTGKG